MGRREVHKRLARLSLGPLDPDASLLADLQAMRVPRDFQRQIEQGDEFLRRFLGDEYRGRETDWLHVGRILGWTEQYRACRHLGAIPVPLQPPPVDRERLQD